MKKILWLLILSSAAVNAGVTGKIAGKVTDVKTGKPLPGVNVVVVGTTLGAATDENGEYFIIQVPPGVYSVEVRMLGYTTVTKSNVRVSVDLTTRLDFRLRESVLEMQGVTVRAERPLVLPDITSSARYTTKEEMDRMAGVEKVGDVIGIQPGVVTAAPVLAIQDEEGRGIQVRGERASDVHIRGGRGGEILYCVDGLPITHPLYGGRQILELDVVSVQEMEILTGGFNAEYGQAQSGVINIVTREGGRRLSGSIQLKTDRLSPENYSFNTDYVAASIGGPEPVTNFLLSPLGVHIPGEVTFFASGSGNLTNTYLSNHRTRETNEFLGFEYSDRQNNDFTGDLKVAYKITPNHKLTLGYRSGWSRSSWFDWGWKDLPDSMQSAARTTEQLTLNFTHTLSPKTFYTVKIGRLKTDYESTLNRRTPPLFWHWDSVMVVEDGDTTWKRVYVGSDYGHDTDENGFIDVGVQGNYRKDNTYSYTLRGDITSQVHPRHLIKSGFEFNYHKIKYTDIQYAGSYYYEGRDTIPGSWPEYGLYRWVFDAFPYIGAAYLQDKVELEGLIINAGARVDFFDPGRTVRESEYIAVWERATGIPLEVKKMRYWISPRLGISHPITERTAMYFAYGRFNQLPELQYYYRDPWTGTWCGNPNLDPEITTAYEFGFTHQITGDMALDVKNYSKDISGYVGMIKTGYPGVWVWVNRGYGRCRGVELQLIKRYSHFVSGTISYTYQWATAYASSAFMEYDRSRQGFPIPIRENRLDWDQRNMVVADVEFSVPEGESPKLLGLRIPDRFYTSLLFSFGSGVPYTPAGTDIVITENSKTCPATYDLDLKIQKGFCLGSFNYSFICELLNLFDYRNVNRGVNRGAGFNSWTGRPYRYGDVGWGTGKIYTYRDIIHLRNPVVFSSGRQIKLGINLNF
ncbi:hypothetical protein CH333_03705 [candidate division WOR-3 bacterium JGI_Cruoil_03_44_89]|uniref:TonB-dependent receptor plug domain-containing protein n=1 Tax=candidate division WOR-3 bacterium JGI_Cruoil_03_44_89 TaxID=1973748 RepID=A0A235BXN8_UNCW3|nr:MAG: hypothetical protein CH333_03705 [candidate division WOR-3 bacterium JGI_Cruoil_03_44_89]